ncbi:MAG: LLM class flavin-dependent oxidoreductase [Nitrospinota bacterium]|nr:LLM class flavin-dependent oxidoreductase [Nitrospinota bacterium]MDP7167865.1 LLM class flavin-dependent oxidoreductase [Nitrospinota bacterium]MDP7371803.1 LLM class flavin-dependent oxidoreductase [Nitrospinota bacterium]MDP7663993.1 LLM class flavin-dependent oxidoreductase [Nitrospinota bacterium]HJP15143.1 LLM class flavin-dependent oxidoreductase [Nitrospinota bacterium]
MRFGIQISSFGEFPPIDEFLDFVREAEALGINPITLADSVSTSRLHSRDIYVMLALMARETKRAQIGTSVTNFVTRHIMTTVNAMASVDDLAEGRVMIGFGAGDTPLYSVGLKSSSLNAMREGLIAARALLNGEPVELGGTPVTSNWRKPHLPIFLAADGPRTLELAGELADGVILGSGITPEVVSWARGHIAAGAERAGRRPEEIELWLNAIVHIEEDGAAARETVRPRLCTRANHNFRLGMNAVPVEEREGVERFRANYDELNIGAGSPNAKFITDYMIDRFAVVGSPDECLDRFREIAGLGAKTFVFAMSYTLEARRKIVRFVGERALPELGG